MKLRSILLPLGLFCAVILFAGCFSSKFTLGRPEDAKVEAVYVGNWQNTDDQGKKINLIVRNIDNHRYYAEWTDGKETQRYVGFVTPINDVSFAQLRPLTADGSIADEYAIMRVAMKDDQLTVRQLSENFFKEKPINSSDDLRKLVTDSLTNQKMYDDDVTFFKRMPAKDDGIK